MGKAKINPEQMKNWSDKINKVNEEIISLLNDFEDELEDLENYWQGTSSDNFISATTSLTKKAQDYHNNMKQISNFLNEVTNRYSSE